MFPLRACLAASTVLLLGNFGAVKSAHEAWKIRLAGKGGIQSFERPINRVWTRQQGVVFLSPERLAVYQVNQTAKPAPLAHRGTSGGAGNFYLLARLFDAGTGQEMQRIQAVTSAEFSSILPTHDGNFIVRTGNSMALYSPQFSALASRQLPLDNAAPVEYWEVKVTPSGKQVVIAHQQRAAASAFLVRNPAADSESKADVEILDADTLATIRRLHVPHYLPIRSVQENFLLTTEPGRPMNDTVFGTMDLEGNWTVLHPAWEKKLPCNYNIDLLDHGRMAASGCGNLIVFTPSDEILLNVAEDQAISGPVTGADNYVAFELAKFGAGPLSLKPAQIQVYDLKLKKVVISVDLEKSAASYALSPSGTLAVVDGDELKVFQANE